jgi:hypothetical protein
MNSGRFLDPPEFQVFHDKGNEQNFFDRVDYTFSPADSVHLDLNYSRSWFQTPNSYDSLNVQNVVSGGASASPVFANVGNADQRSKIGTINISPTYTRVVNNSVLNVGAFVRRDEYNYYPSANPLADLGPANLQTSSIQQSRTLTNSAVHADYSYSKGIHTIKAGAQYGQTFLNENDSLGIVGPDLQLQRALRGCKRQPLARLLQSRRSAPAGRGAESQLPPVLAPYDFTRGGSYYNYAGHTDVKELGLFASRTRSRWRLAVQPGPARDVYNGLTDANQTQPRVGIAYNIKPTATVLRISYARTLETPFNENLVLSSEGCSNAVLAPLLACSSGVAGTLQPGFRNEFHAGLQQAFGKRVVVSGEYIWKYTHNAFDFSVLGNTPITFPIDWHNSKIPGYALHVDVPEYHHVSAYVVAVFGGGALLPAAGGRSGRYGGSTGLPFRIDHDEKFNQETHVQYTFRTARRSAGFGAASTGATTRARCRLSALLQPASPTIPTAPAANLHLAQRPAGGEPEQLDGGRRVSGRTHLRRGKAATPGNPLPAGLPGVGVWILAGQDSRARHRRQRPQPAAHSAAQPV